MTFMLIMLTPKCLSLLVCVRQHCFNSPMRVGVSQLLGDRPTPRMRNIWYSALFLDIKQTRSPRLRAAKKSLLMKTTKRIFCCLRQSS